MHVTGTMCKTNIPSCTAFRGFGGPQSQVVTETWIAHIASFLRFSPEKVESEFLINCNFFKPLYIIFLQPPQKKKFKKFNFI